MFRCPFPISRLVGLALAFVANTAAAGTVTVITSIPKELTSAYIENLGRLFVNEPDLDFAPPRHLLAAFGMSRGSLTNTGGVDAISVAAAEAAARREDVNVMPL